MPFPAAWPSSMSETLARLLLTAAAVGVVGAVAYLGRRRERRSASVARLRLDGVQGRVLFFTDSACKRCDVVRHRLESLGAAFREIAYNHEPELQQAIGVTGVPLLVVRDRAGTIVDRVAGVASVGRIRRALPSPDDE